ncbi:unnamed protein product [Cylicostephanus goldi]|uniref:Uncharacterized protein n=1 Tax=Cylicostephanus goldi TaxID=71465 RepID=A0A3P6QCL4_CYLGO|nr:unnamed protein product [Cylicostephanus goldi]
MCNPPNALQENVKAVWYIIAFVLCGVTLFCYVLAFLVLSYKRNARKSMRSLTVIFSTFLCTRFITILTANALNIANAVTAMISYSLNFYVIFWRSRDYREHLRQQQKRLLRYFFGICFQFATKNVFFSNQAASTSAVNITVISARQR